MHKMANMSLANRALVALITVFVMVFGVVTTGQLKQELVPSMTFPQAFIVANYPGASPQVVEQRVTTPIEQAVLTLQGVESSESTSTNGMSTVTVTMKYGSNMNAVQQDIQAALSRIESILPEDASTQVITGGFDSIPVLVLSVSSDMPPGELAKHLESSTVPRLQKLSGVRAVDILGAPEEQVLVKLDAKKLVANKLSALEVMQALGASGQLSSGGAVNEADKTLSVTVGKRFASAEDVGKVMITPQAPGSTPVALSEVATVKQQEKPTTSISRTNGRSSLTLAISKTSDANTVAVADAVKADLTEIETQLGSNTHFTTVFDQAPFITQSIHDLLTEGGLGLVAAIMVILLFLLSVRSTLVTAVSIPVSLLATMIGLRVFGYSLNILTLGAITIAVGRVVDDSIVVIENINRHLAYGTPKMEAIKIGVREVATAVTAATITTVAVFAPIALVGGQTGELFRPFAMTVTLALLGSLVVSLTIVPVLAYWFLKGPKGQVDAEQVRAEAEAREHRDWMQRLYVPSIRWSLRHPVIVLLFSALLLGGTGALSSQLKTNFLGDSGQNTMSITQSFPPSLSLEEQDRRTRKVEQALGSVKGVQTVQLTVGSSGNIFFGGGSDEASYNVTTDPEADQTALQAEVRRVLSGIQGEDLTVNSAMAAGSNSIDVVLTGSDSAKLKEASDAVVAKLRTVSSVTDVKSSLASDRPQVGVVLKQPEAANAGVTEQMVAQLLRGALAPAQIGQVETANGTAIDVTLQTADAPVGLAALQAMPVMTAKGPVPLSQVAEVKQLSVPTSISHHDGERSVTVSVTPTTDNLTAASNDVSRALDSLSLPSGTDASLGGVTADQNEAFAQLGLALLAAIAIVYVVMVATFKSLVQPLILAVSIPFAATGALLGLIITDTPLGIPSMIGMLMLVGIVVTNAIVLIDLVNHYRQRGEDVDTALVDGARRRLRPILMTALATVGALTPMALGLSGGGVFISKPLAIVVIGGLLSSTLLTLVLVPVLYHLVEGHKERRARRRAEKEGGGASRAEGTTEPEDGPVSAPRHAAEDAEGTRFA